MNQPGATRSAVSRAAVFQGPRQPLELCELAWPKLKAGEVLVEILCCTLCGSDLHTYQGKRSAACPIILGHEMVGRVAELPAGDAVCDHEGRSLQVGERVTWSIVASCHECEFCRRGFPQKCAQSFKYGHQQLAVPHELSGGLAEFCHLAAGTTIVRVPEHVPDAVASLANCAVATVAAMQRVTGEMTDSAIVIHGAGMLGLTAAAFCQWRGAKAILVSDTDPQRLARAAAFGATHTVLAGDGPKDLQTMVEEVTGGRGVDTVWDLSGATEAMQVSPGLLRIGGSLILAGRVFPGPPVEYDPQLVVRHLLRIEGVHNYRPDDLVTAMQFLAECGSRLPFAELVETSFPLTDIEEAFQYAIDRRPVRVAVTPGNPSKESS